MYRVGCLVAITALLLAFAVDGGGASPQAPSDPQVLHVQPGGAGNSPASRPFDSLADALSAAGPGDTIVLAPGTYHERLATVRGGSPGAPITIRAADQLHRPILTASGRVATFAHPWVVVEHVEFDGQFGPNDTVRVTSAASHLTLRHVEVRRSGRDCVDMAGPADVTVEHARIHHCLNPENGRTDAHGIVAGNAANLTIRHTDIHTFSGDAIQLDPGRMSPGWTNLRVEGCRLWLEPLPTAVHGFAAGVVPGENAIDTKTPVSGARASLTVVDTEAWGFAGGLINNMAAFNIKERVDAIFDRVTAHHSTIAFRLRGGGEGGARVTMSNVVVHSVATAVRVEDNVDTVRLYHATFGRDVGRAFQRASSPQTPLDVHNLLALGPTLPNEASGRGLPVDASAFVDAATHDYRLAPTSPAIDRATSLPGLDHDRLGVRRPQGPLPDLGAYEYCTEGCPPQTPTLRVAHPAAH